MAKIKVGDTVITEKFVAFDEGNRKNPYWNELSMSGFIGKEGVVTGMTTDRIDVHGYVWPNSAVRLKETEYNPQLY